MEDKVKRHGCMCPLHPFQIGAYLVFLIKVGSFYTVSAVAMGDHPEAQIIISVLFSAFFLTVAAFTAIATLSDPTDPTVYLERKQKNLK